MKQLAYHSTTATVSYGNKQRSQRDNKASIHLYLPLLLITVLIYVVLASTL